MDFQQKNVLVTGAAGFVGSHLVDALLDAGASVVGVDSLITGRKLNLSSAMESSHFVYIQADVTENPSTYLPADLEFDFAFHFASPASPPLYQKHPVETYMVNSYGTHCLLRFLSQHSPSCRFVFASTSEVYGDPELHPQPETYWGRVNPNGIRSCYDESKRLGVSICGVFFRDFDVDVRIVRIFNTYGPRINPADGRVVPAFIVQAVSEKPVIVFGDGTQTRCFCYVSDLVKGVMMVASSDAARGYTVNLGNPNELTMLGLATKIQNLASTLYQKQSHPIQFEELPGDDPTRRKPDIRLATELLNWEPLVSLEDGLGQTMRYFMEHELG